MVGLWAVWKVEFLMKDLLFYGMGAGVRKDTDDSRISDRSEQEVVLP